MGKRVQFASGAAASNFAESSLVESSLIDSGLADSGLVDSGLVDSNFVDSNFVDSSLVDSGPAGSSLSASGLPDSVLRFEATRPLHFWHLASFDAPTVAAVWSLSFAWAAGVKLPLWVPVLQVLVVWAVYVGDRLLDTRAGLGFSGHPGRRTRETLRDRHYFHWRHRRVLLPLAVMAACAAAAIILAFMPMVARVRNSVLAAATLAYFTRIHSGAKPRPFLPPLLSKELLVGVLFTGGCALPALSAAADPRLWPLGCAVVFFALLAWLNCHAIDHWEVHQGSTGRSPIFWTAIGIGGGGLLLAALLDLSAPGAAALAGAGALSALLLALLDQTRSRLARVTLRAAADLALLTPVLLVPLRHPASFQWLAR